MISIDVKTGQVIIASSTCVRQEGFPARKPNGARDLMDVQAVIVPGVGVAACQAGVDNTRENQMLVYREIQKGTPPADIIEMLKKANSTDSDKVSKALLGLTIETPIGTQTIREKDHQANRGQLYGKTVMDPKYPFAIMKPVTYVDPSKFMD